MAFEKMGNFSFNHANQADELNLPADEAKAKFDSRANELKTAFNKAVDLLNSTTAGNSGADNVKATTIDGVTGTSVQSQMESMKGLVDGKAANNHNHDSSYAPLADYTLQVPYAEATGTTNIYSVTLNPAPSSLVNGLAVAVKIPVDSTSTSTLNVNGLGAKTIKKANGTNVTNLKAGGIYTLRYNGVNFILQGEGASGNATASDLLSGKTATTDAGEITGTIPNRGAVSQSLAINGTYTIPEGYHNGSGQVTQSIPTKGAQTYTPTTTNQTIAAGQYLSGIQTIAGSANLVPGNIKEGVNIFGILGSLPVGSKYASGTALISSSTSNFEYISSTNFTSVRYCSVSTLTFLPTLIVIYSEGVNSGLTVYTSGKFFSAYSSGQISCNAITHSSNGNFYTYGFKLHSPAYVNSTSFLLPCYYSSGGDTAYWFACAL